MTRPTAAPFCYVCRQTDRELRPYGRKGKPICFPCMKADPSREREAQRRMRRALLAAGDIPVIGSDAGILSVEEAQRRGLAFQIVDPRVPGNRGRA